MKRLSLLLTACALSPLAHGQAYGTICSETFEYPTGGLGSADGGIGWNAPWYSGANLDDALVTTPGLDGVGEKCTTQFSNAGSFRMPQTGPHPDLAPNFNFGSGDGVMWITFTAGRVAGTTDDYGGLSLITQFGGEHLFIGAPYQTYEWGIVDVVSGNVITVPGSNIDQTTTLVVRIGFAQGGDTVDLWVDLRNVGSEAWSPSTTRLAPLPRDTASPVQSDDWLSTGRILGVPDAVAPDTSIRLAFTVVVTEPGPVDLSL